MGKIQWEKGLIDRSDARKQSEKRNQKLKIRKGLPHDLPKDIQKLVQHALLHDFFHTSKHRSKIYVEPELDDLELKELLRQHHEKSNETLVKIFQKYDRIAAMITRKIRSPKINRYNWYAKENIDFVALASEIKEVAIHSSKLYWYILNNKELNRLNESLEHGHSSLRNHLLVIANLIVQDFQQGRLRDSLHTERDRLPLPSKCG